MDALIGLVFLTMLATIAALARGVGSMAVVSSSRDTRRRIASRGIGVPPVSFVRAGSRSSAERGRDRSGLLH
jgi:hypothetical protein